MGAGLFRRAIRAAAVVVLGGAVAACGLTTPKKPPPPCPPILVLKDAATLTKMRPGPGRDITDILFSGQITDFRAECTFEKDLSEVEIKLNIAFVLTRGAANTDRKVGFEYFIGFQLTEQEIEFNRSRNRF